VDSGISSSSYWWSVLTQLETGLVDAAYKLGTTEALITALDHCRDLIQITDAHNRIQVKSNSRSPPPFIFADKMGFGIKALLAHE